MIRLWAPFLCSPCSSSFSMGGLHLQAAFLWGSIWFLQFWVGDIPTLPRPKTETIFFKELLKKKRENFLSWTPWKIISPIFIGPSWAIQLVKTKLRPKPSLAPSLCTQPLHCTAFRQIGLWMAEQEGRSSQPGGWSSQGCYLGEDTVGLARKGSQQRPGQVA